MQSYVITTDCDALITNFLSRTLSNTLPDTVLITGTASQASPLMAKFCSSESSSINAGMFIDRDSDLPKLHLTIFHSPSPSPSPLEKSSFSSLAFARPGVQPSLPGNTSRSLGQSTIRIRYSGAIAAQSAQRILAGPHRRDLNV